jgi:outer membrane receptor for ferrienterochelin and colicin
MFAAPPATSAAQPAADQSDVIEVIGQRTDQALKIDRRTYRVQQTPHSQQKDAIQLLRGVPAVTVSPDDAISLLGSSSVRIFVDGRPYQGDATQYLRTLHGGDVERIEIITNPSAQYSSEGTGGIINFVLRKKQGDGISGNVSAEATRPRGGKLNGSLKYKNGRWTYELSGGIESRLSRSTYHKQRSVEVAPGGRATVNTEDGGGPTRTIGGFASGKISYDIDPKTSVSAKVTGFDQRQRAINSSAFEGVTPGFQSFSGRQRRDSSGSWLFGELAFDHKGSKEGETLTASLQFGKNWRQRETNHSSFSDGAALFTQRLKGFTDTTAQVDWQHPIGKGQILSVGGTWDRSTMSEDYHFESSGTALSGFTAVDQFSGREDKLAAYATFQQPVGDWTVMPGVRVERDSRRITSRGHPEVRIGQTDLFPTLHVDHRLTKSLDLTLSYSKRIDRPPLNELRPYEIVQDVLTVKRGDPLLKNQSTDAYEINLHYHRNKVDAGVIIYDRETSHLFSSDYSVVNGVNVSMLVNAGHSRDRGAEIDASTQLIGRVKLNATVNLFDQQMPTRALAGRQSDERFRYTTDATIQWTGPDRGKRPGDVAQLQWIYSSPETDFELHSFAWNWLSLSYTHSFTQTLSLTGTANYVSRIGHRLIAPLVQEYYAERRPVEFRLKLLKTFGKP